MKHEGRQLLFGSSVVALLAAFALTGCFELDPQQVCAPGTDVQVQGAAYCVYEQPIVIETGFQCPPERPNQFVVGDGTIACSDNPNPPVDPFGNLLPMPGDGTPPDGTPANPPDGSGSAGSGGAPADPGASSGTTSTATDDDSAEVETEPEDGAEPEDGTEVEEPDDGL